MEVEYGKQAETLEFVEDDDEYPVVVGVKRVGQEGVTILGIDGCRMLT